MHAHFTIEQNFNDVLQLRIVDFKKDSHNMKMLNEFVDDVLQTAECEALKKHESSIDSSLKQVNPKGKSRQNFSIPDFRNGKVVNRARGLMVRLFDAICNCANSAATAPTQRVHNSKRSSSSSTAAVPPATSPPQQQEQQQIQQQQ